MNWNNSTVLFLRFNLIFGTKCKKCENQTILTHTCRFINKYKSSYGIFGSVSYVDENDFIENTRENIKNGKPVNFSVHQFCSCNGCSYMTNPCKTGLSKFYTHTIKSLREKCLACNLQSKIKTCPDCLPNYYYAIVCHIPNEYLNKTDITNTVYILSVFKITLEEHANLATVGFGKNVNWLFQKKPIEFQTSVYSTIDVYDESFKSNAEFIRENLYCWPIFNPKFNGYAKESDYNKNLLDILEKYKQNSEMVEKKPNPHVSEKKRTK